jgi:glycosyltransferase involved in cell wall biosynthesis
MNIKISVIIPVYNSELYISECIESLINQSLQECEFIFINDGSIDKSSQIIEKYSKQDSRIILINQENKGISIARNTGLDIATGEYIGFVDNDDFVKYDMYETLYNQAIKEDLDIVISKTILGRDGKYLIKDAIFPIDKTYYQDFIQSKVMINLLKVEDLFAVWNKIYKKSLIDENKICFPKNRIIEEDNMFNLQAFNFASKVKFIDYGGYYFRENAISESRNFIENDYFEKSLDKFHFDYIKEYNLKITYDIIGKLKAIRFIQRVFYLTFVCVTYKRYKFKVKTNYISKMLFHPTVYENAIKYHSAILQNKGIFESLLYKIIINKSKTGLYLLVFLVKLVYHPNISEIIRFINNPKKIKTEKI